MGNKCCKNQSSTYSSANATIRSFSSYNSSILRSSGSHAITFGTSTRGGDSLTTLTMKSSNHSDVGSRDYQGDSSSTVGQEELIPIFLRRLNDLNIRVGTRTRLLIELDDATGVQVRWYHNNVEANNERYQYIHEGGFYCLDIVPVTLFDEGLWVCTAQNYAGKSSTAAHLSLTVPKAFKKPIFVESLKAVLTQRGIVSLECKVIGVPTPKLRWYKDDKEIKAGDIFALTANSEEDCLGIYTCEATNVMGTALSTSKIQVTHTPLDGNHDADSLIPYGPQPKFVKLLKNASGKVGSVLFLECQVEVPPWPRSIGWYNDNGIVNEGPLYHLIADGLGMYGVEIKSLRADHSTTWKCVATSSTGAKAVTSCVVSVSYPKNYRVPRFLESLRAIMTDEGLVSFECKVIGYPTPQLLWFKDGKQLQPGDVYELTGSKSLGSYCCVARNCMGETSSFAELTIEDIQNQLNESEKLQLTSNTQPPRFLLGLKSIEANINESFVFMIKVTTESTPSISWYKEDEQITESNRYHFSTEDNGIHILNIVPLEIDDQAEWKCIAINKYGQTATSSFLKLNIPKNFKSPRFLEELRIAFSNEGSVNLECKVIGVPQPQLKWFKDGQELNPGDMHKIISGQSGTCCLGTYTCQAHNCMGTVSSSATLLTMEDKSTVKSCASEEYLSVGNPLVRNESLSTIPEERTSQMEKSYTIEEPADISFSFDGKEVTVSLYETPDLTHDEALQIIEMYADELSEHISEDNVVDLPSLRIVKESSISGPVMMEALVIDVPIDFCRQQTVSDTEFDGISLTEDITLANNDQSESICENSLEYFSDHLSSGNSKREVFYSASETTPKNSTVILKQKLEDDGHHSFQTSKLFMSNSDDQILTQLKLDEKHLATDSRHVFGPLSRSESNNTEEEVSETLAEIDNEPPLSHNDCATEIATKSDEDGLYSTVLNKICGKGMTSMILSSEEDDILNIISKPNASEFLKYMKIILEGTMVKMRSHEKFNFTGTTTELERSIQALHSLAWKFIEETEKNDVTEMDKNTTDNVSSLMTAINASLLVLEQIDDPFGVSDNVLNEIQSLVCFDLETFNNNDIPATVILNRLSDQIKNFTLVVNRQVAQITEQRTIAVLQNTIGTTLEFIKTLQQNCSKMKCVDINSLVPLFSMVQPLESIINDIANMEEASVDDNKPNFKLKQILIPPISSIAFALDNLNKALKNDGTGNDPDLKDIYDRINDSTNQFMTLASHGMENNKIAECFISFTKPINDLCCHLRRLGRSTENIVSSDYGSDDKLLIDFETLFDELMIDIATLINNVNFVQDSENNMNPLGSLLEPLQDMKIGLFQINQVLLSNQTGSSMSFEVMSCFEHLSQQLVQLNNCIVNQSIVEETDKEIPFESSIKMMQNILFDDAIDDLGVNGILFGSVMKPLLQLQNLIVSKMASVESDLSFSEHTDVTGGACETQSLSLSLSHNAQTMFDKTANEKSQQVITKSSIIDSSDKSCDKQNNMYKDTPETEKDSIHFENNINNDLAIKRGFECDIGETFKYDEPNIITSEDDIDNSGFGALFDETDLETSSNFVEDVCLDSIMNSNVGHKLPDLLINRKDTDNMHKKTDDIIPEHVLESLENINQSDLILNSPVDLFGELQETLKNMSEVECDRISDMYDMDNNKTSVNDLHNVDSIYINQIRDKTTNLLDDSLDENFENEYKSINDQSSYREEQVFEIEQDVDFVEDLECLDTDKSISNNTIITINETSDPSEVKIKEINNIKKLETVVDIIASKTGNVDQIVDVSDKNKALITSANNVVSKINNNDVTLTNSSDFKNETLDSEILSKLNSSEFIQNIKVLSSEDIMIDTNKFNKSEKNNISKYNGNNMENKNIMLINEVEVFTTENDSDKSIAQDDIIVNEIDAIHNLRTDAVIQIEETKNENEYYKEKDKQIILTDKCTNTIKLNKELGTCINPKNMVMVESHNSSIIEEMPNKIKQCDNSDLLNKSISLNEERTTPANEPMSSMVDINLIKVLKDNKSKGIIEEPNSVNENTSLVKSKYNETDKFETNQDVNLDKKLQHDLQPNINAISLTDYNQIVPNHTNCENLVNPIIKLNVLQNEEYGLMKKHKVESELINEEPSCNDQQNPPITQRSNILQQSNNEIEVRSVVQQCIIDKTKHIDNTSITQYNNSNNCVDFMLPATEMIQTISSNDKMDKQLVVTNSNPEENESIALTKFKNDVNSIKRAVNLTLNEKQAVTDNKINIHPENKTTEIVVNDEEKSINTLKTSFTDLKQPTILKNNDKALLENTLVNNDVITIETTQLIDSCKFDESQVEIQFEENIDSRNGVLDDKVNIIINFDHLETKNEIINIPDEMIIKDQEKLFSEGQYIQNDETNIVSEQKTALICNETISESNAQQLDTVVINLENIKEKYEKKLCVSKSNNITAFEDKIDTAEKKNQDNEDLERVSNDKLIFKSLDEDNLIYGKNKSEQLTTYDYTEIYISKTIDEKLNPVSSKNDIMQSNCDILKTINNVGTENIGKQMLTKLQMSNERGDDVSLTENDSVATTDIDLETTKTYIEKVDKIKIHASEVNCLPLNNDQIIDLYDVENELAKRSLLIKENTEDCNISSHPNTCIEILNEDNTNLNEEFTEHQTYISGNFQTLESISHEKNPKLNTVINDELLNINKNNTETDKTSEKMNLKNDIDKNQSKNRIDMCESSENNKVLVNNKKQTISLCDTKAENINEKLTEDSENNTNNCENNFEKSFDYKNSLESIEQLKNHAIKTENIKKDFINLKDLETTQIKLETTIDQTSKIDYTESTKQEEYPNFEKMANLVVDKLNMSFEDLQCERLIPNENVCNTNIKISESNISVSEIFQINAEVDIIDQYKDISKMGTQDMTDNTNEKRKYLITNDYSDENFSCKSNLSLSEIEETQKRKLIFENKEYEQSKINTYTINIKKDTSINEMKFNDNINVVTDVENNGNPLNDVLIESEISDLPAEKLFDVHSITPKLHCVEKIAINEAECMLLENTNILNQGGELDTVNNVNHNAHVEHKLYTAVIGNITMGYDSIKENPLTTDKEKKCTENATLSLTFENHPFEIVSTNVDILKTPTKDSIVEEEQTIFLDIVKGSENSTSSPKIISDNKNFEILKIDILSDQIENKKNLASKSKSMNRMTEIFNEDTSNKGNLYLKTEQKKEVADKLQHTLKNSNQTFEFLENSVKQNDNSDLIKTDVLIPNYETENENKTATKLDKKSLSPDTTKSNARVSEINVDTTVIDKNNDENNKILSDVKIETKLNKIEPEIVQDINKVQVENIEKVISNADKNQKSSELCTDDGEKLTGIYVEKGNTKRGSKKSKSSPRPENKKSPSPETTKSNVHVSEINVDTTVIDKNNDENNKILSDVKIETKLNKIEPEIVQDLNKVQVENIEKVISNADKNQKSSELCTDDGEKSTEIYVEKGNTKRGSKKSKSSPRPEDKKSPSPETTKSNVHVSEINVDTTVIDKNNDENNKILSDVKIETKLNKIEPEIVQDLNKVQVENIEKLISNADKNQKSSELCTDDGEKSTEIYVKKGNTKRGSKKSKSSPRPEDKKSPSPETTKSNVHVSEINVDTTVIDKNNDENNKILSDVKIETKLNKIEPEIVQDLNKVQVENIEKVISNADKNQKSSELCTDDGEKLTGIYVEKGNTKRGSKKSKSSPRPENKKSPSPETTKSNVHVSEINVDTTVIDKNNDENNKILSDVKIETKLNKIEPEIVQDLNKVQVENIEKVISNADKNQKSSELCTDDGEKSTEIYVEKGNTKRGSKKSKSSPRPEDKKSPSPETTKSNVHVSEINVDTTVIDKNNDENNKILSDVKIETKLNKIEPEIVQDLNKVQVENIEKLISNADKNQKSSELCTDDGEKSTEIYVEKGNTKRGSKKSKSSPRPEDKKSPSPETTKSNVHVSEINVDTTVIDKNNDENNKILSDVKIETKLNKIEPEIVQDLNKVQVENIEKLISNADKNQKSSELCTDDGEKSTEIYVEKGNTKRGSKKSKSSPRPEDKKSPSPETTISNVHVSEINVDTTVIDKNNDENNKMLSDVKIETKLNKIEPEIVQDLNTVQVENIEKLISNADKNQKSSELCTDDGEKSTEIYVEKGNTKRGSKKSKSSPRPEDKKSPSPETTKCNVHVSEINVDTTVIDKNNDENNKILSDVKIETKLNKIEPEIVQDLNKVQVENIEKLISNADKNQKSSELCTDDGEKSTEIYVEKGNTKRGSKKSKSSPRPEDKKSPSPETTKSNVHVSEINVDTTVIDKNNDENNKTLLDDKAERDKTESFISPYNYKNSKEIFVNDVSTDNRNEIRMKNEIGADDKIKLTDKNETKDEKRESTLRLNVNKSTLPDIKFNNEKLEGINEIENKEKKKICTDITENFIELLSNSNSAFDNMKHRHKMSHLENKNIEVVGKSKINVIDSDLLTNTNKSISYCNKKERESGNRENSSKSSPLVKSVRTDTTTVNKNFDIKPKDIHLNCQTSNRKERKLIEMTEHDDVNLLEVGNLDKRPVNRYLLDVADACKFRPNTLANRSPTPEPLTSYRSLIPDYQSAYRSLTPESPSYRSSLTPRSKYATPTRYAGSSDRELYGSYSSSHSSISSSRCTSPYPSEPRISTQRLLPTYLAAYRCHSETSIPFSPRRMKVETTSNWPYTSYGMATRKRRGSDSFLHDLGVRDGGYYSSWRLSDGWAATSSASEDLYRTKEAFKGLYFCVRMIDQTVSSGARVKFWCSIIGHPEPRVQWYRDGQKLNNFTYNSSARYQTKYEGGLAQLIVDNAQSGDSGEYTCVASNGRDRISTTGFLTVYTSPSVFRKPLLQPSLSVDGIESGRRLYSQTNHDFRFPVNDKFYFGGQKFGDDFTIRHPEYPKFMSNIIADDVVTYGGTIALQVRIQGSPVPNVTWMRESRPLPRSSVKYIYLDEGGLFTLLVMDSTTRDGGKYVCRACNLYGVVDAEKAVRVVSPQDYTDRRGVKPAIIVSRPNDRLNVAVGEDITVTLRVAGEPKPKVLWMRGSRDVTFLDRSLKETVNDYVMLSIKKAQPSDAGTYFIIAKNMYGSDRAFVTVGVRQRARSLTPPQIRNTISRWFRPTDGVSGGRRGCENNDVPGPVRSKPTVTDRTNKRISLQWDRPEKPETVLVYRVETRSADEECWRQVGMTPTNTIDVYNLKPGYRYQFRVTARNRFGWSQPVASEEYVEVFEPKCLPEFHQPLPGETRVLLQHSATLQCHVRGVPEPRVRWFKDGEPLMASDRHVVGRTNAGKCTLTISDVADGDAGRYSCEAVNDQGRVCTLTVVQVIANRRIVEAERRLQGCLMKNNDFKESAPMFTKHLIDRRVNINSTVRLSCQVNGLPVPLVLWYKDGQPIDFASGTEGDRKPPVRDDSDDFYTLELTGVKYDDSGAYAAVASNAIGKASSRCVLEVYNKNRTDPAVPAFVFSLPPTIEAVDSIVLSAQIDAYRPAKVEWYRDGIQLRNGRRVDIITDHDGNLELRIACVTNRDSGTYMLRVSNDTGTVESRCDVKVVEREHKDTGMEQISLNNHLYSKKPKFVVKPKFQEVEEGQEVIIDSEIVGDPLPKITWLRDGLKPEYYRDNSEFLCVSNGNRYQLKIPHAKLTHTGTYTLLAANPHGQIKALISLQVYSTGHCKKKMENGSNYATVERLPRISRGLVDIECRENDSVSFECKLNITQETDIRWQKDGKLVRLGKQIKSQLVDGDTARLDISNASPLHEGLYTCTAFNELGQDSTSARLILLSDSEAIAKVPQSNEQQKTMLNSPILAGEVNDRCTKRLKRSSAPKFYAVLHDRIADVGETVRFLCSVSGHPPPWSSWEKDGQPIGVNSRMRIREDDDHRSLEICDVTSEDAGLYRITVENKFGKIQATARLEVLTHNQTTNDIQITSSSNGRRQSGSAACAGENFTLSCDIRGNSMSDVTWYKDDEKIKLDDRVTSSLDDLAARLSISNLESTDTGVYTCVARCKSGVTRCSTELCVFDTKPGTDSYLQPPIFVKGLVPKRTADEGEPVQLTVRLQGAVPMSASWFKNNVPVPDCADFEYVVANDRNEFGLSIIDPFVKDSGTYSCKVANTFGQAISSGQLIINEMSSEHQGPMVVELNNNFQNVGEKSTCDSNVTTRTALPASIISGPYDTTVLRGAKVVLKASYRGDPEPCVQWLRGGKVLESNAHLCISNECGVSSLTIDSITADDCGKYVVRVNNGHGDDFHFASVAVEGPPDPPAGRPVVSVSETSADVTWSSPAYDGGCMVTGYGVEVRPFNQSDWKLVADKCHSLSHIVRGLAPGESYVFRVRAENMHGSSEASLESTPVYILQTDYGNTLWPKTVNIENGEKFDKQYEVLDELGKGRYGVVYKVKERETNKFYAAKLVRCIKSTDKEKAQEEVDIMNCLRHPKLLQLDAAFDKPREVVLVTEYISGGELFERVVADDFTLTEKDCILFTRQICEGVDYMHKQNVVHLDLKPENIMCQSRTSHYVKLIDFGLAQKIIPGQPMRVLFGTPEFIPPEIIGYEPIGLESDMWSVGVICYVLLSGLSPFMGDNDSETFTNITKADFDFDDEAFDAVSQDAKDFISALLIKRKELRLTARECLKHKWLAQQDMDMSCVILSTDKLKKFIIRRKWQKTGNAIRALGRMATLSAASRRGVSGTGSGCGTGSVSQKLKMASLREEESAGESPSKPQETPRTETTKNYSGRRSCDARSDSGFSDCPSVASPIAILVRPTECQSIISEDTPPVFDQDRYSPPPTHHSPLSTTRHSPSPTLTDRPSSPTTRSLSNPVTRGSSPFSTHLRSPILRNRHDVTHPVHNIPLPTGTKVSGVCKTNRMIFDSGRLDGNASSPGVSAGSVQRKEPIRIQRADNFKKAVAFWKQ